MKDTVLTVRLPRSTRERIEELAREEGRSLSQQVERLLERALVSSPALGRRRGLRSLSAVLRGGRVPTLNEFREVRRLLTVSLERRLEKYDESDRRHPRRGLARRRPPTAR